MTRSVLLLVVLSACITCTQKKPSPWLDAARETRPWTRWWWHGSALTKEGITAELEAYRKAGLGGVEITPIYGVRGSEDKFVPYLSDEWMDLLEHTLAEAERLDMGVDMATGTGWPFGGPWVTEEFASRDVAHKEYELQGGQSLKEKIEFIQPSYLRTVRPTQVEIKDLVQPVEKNNNLQELAIDQVQFETSLPLIVLMGYSDKGEILNLTQHIGADQKLNWSPPSGKWKLHALFIGWHGKMVERAGPGGEGTVIDHFSKTALRKYLDRFDSAFQGRNITSLRGFFNDSYEVDDARGAADWTPTLLDEFRKRRGYNLEDHLDKLFGAPENDTNRRILYDYRCTISEMILENFTTTWTDWASQKKAITRNQAHGSPANILDLYSTVDIPEIEGSDPLRIRMASSAGNISGKRLISSESATWLDEHFESGLGDVKSAVDLFLLNGVNHIFYHGTSYSPPGEPWPGWLFYAAVHLNPRNPQWVDFDVLNNYITRCQSLLQNTKAKNDVLLYYPFADPMSTFGPEMIEHFDGIGKQFAGSMFEDAATIMLEKGFTFDFISDKQLLDLKYENNRLITTGGSRYKTMVVPNCEFMPLETLATLVSLAESGATVINYGGDSYTIAGFGDLEKKQGEFERLSSKGRENTVLENGVFKKEVGKGMMMASDHLEHMLRLAGVEGEDLSRKSNLEFTRRRFDDGRTLYMIRNPHEDFDDWIQLKEYGPAYSLFEPMTGKVGRALRRDDGEIHLQLSKGQTIFAVVDSSAVNLEPFDYTEITGTAATLSKWTVTFESGGPAIPPPLEMEDPLHWTSNSAKEYQEFSGTAVYKTSFEKPDHNLGDGWILDLGEVHGTARVFLNGEEVGALISPPFRVKIELSMAQPDNVLEVRVTNLMANRIIALDKNGVKWKKFYNINFPARKEENRKDGLFDASKWVPRPSGLGGPVQLLFIEKRAFQ